MVIEFADLASYQHGTDLAAYARAGHDRIGLKATQGTSYIAPDLAVWWRQAGALGLARLAYHYADAADPGAQAGHFLSTVGPRGPRDVLAVDAEWSASPKAADGRRTAALVGELANRGATTGMVYSRASWLTAAQLLPAMLPAGWRWLWLAHYGVKTPAIPAGWTSEHLRAWQFTDRAPTAGVPGPCDRSRVLREWLPEGDDMPTAQEIAAAVWAAAPPTEGVDRPIAKSRMDQVLAEAYNKAGAIQKPQLTDLAANVADARSELASLRAGLALLVPQDHPVAQALAGAADPEAEVQRLLPSLTTPARIRTLTSLAHLLDTDIEVLSARAQAAIPTTAPPTGGT
jgi:GH25 family lysozyme M1 (1,4-beta-N-acetylmuramidase)